MRYKKIILGVAISWILAALVLKYYVFQELTTILPLHRLVKSTQANRKYILYEDLSNGNKAASMHLNNNLSRSDDVYEQYFSDFHDPYDKKNRFLFLTDAGLQALALKNARQNQFRDRCNPYEINRKIDLSRFVFDDRHKVVMCVVPKNACSSWKRIMLYLQGKVADKSDIENISATDLILGVSRRLSTMRRLSHSEAMKRLLTYTTFFVSRNPFQRLVSAHSSKFTNRSLSSAYKKNTGRAIAAHQAKLFLNGLKYSLNRNHQYALHEDQAFSRLSPNQKNAALRYIDIMNSGEIGFEQFLYYIVARKEPLDSYNYDIHWRPQVNLCNPCTVNYDVVVRFENLIKESNALLKYLQRNDPPDKAAFFDESTPSVIDYNRTRNAFAKIKSKSIMNRLKKLYADDFRILGYSLDNIV